MISRHLLAYCLVNSNFCFSRVVCSYLHSDSLLPAAELVALCHCSSSSCESATRCFLATPSIALSNALHQFHKPLSKLSSVSSSAEHDVTRGFLTTFNLTFNDAIRKWRSLPRSGVCLFQQHIFHIAFQYFGLWTWVALGKGGSGNHGSGNEQSTVCDFRSKSNCLLEFAPK